MKKGLSQFVLFLASLFLIGATTWATDPVGTLPRTTPGILTPASPAVAPAVRLLPGINIFSPKSMETVIKNSRMIVSWGFQGMRDPSTPSVARSPAVSGISGRPTAPVNIYLLNTVGERIKTIASENTQGFIDWTVPTELTVGIYNVQVITVDNTLSAKMPMIVEEYEPPPPPTPSPGTIDCASAKRTICGVVVLQDGLPAAGYRVTAYDSDFGFKDINRDDRMAEGITDSGGVYRITYAGKIWDGIKVTTKWRPDIYIVVHKPKQDGGWKKVYEDPKVYNNHKMADGLKINATIPSDGECPFPERFSTRGFWHGCKCPEGTHKDYTLTRLKGEAKCAPGPSNEQVCNDKGSEYSWIGFDSTDGSCLKISNLLLHRQAYYAFMKHVRSGVDFKPLPESLINRYQPWYTNLLLRDIRIGDSSDNKESTSITDCKRIVFKPGVTESLYNNSVDHITLVLHEMEHANQCMGKTASDYGSKRDLYADMWFKDLPVGILNAFAASNFSMSGAQIHDKMPMEVDADEKAAEIVLATGVGTPPGSCPYGKFSTRNYRGCQCPSGESKHYEGTFKSEATCR